MTTPSESLRRDGFYICRSLLPESDVIAVNESMNRTVRDQLAFLGIREPGNEVHSALRTLLQSDIDRYKRTLAALWRKSDIAALMRHQALFDFVRRELGWRDVFLPGGEVVLVMADDLRIPGGYFGLEPHQDFPSVQGSLDGLVVWIPLTPVDRMGFPLEIVPRSHHRGLISEVTLGQNEWQIDADQLTGSDWLPIEVAVGDVAFISVFTIHRSSRIGAPDRLRMALSTRFDNAAEPTFVERGYPTAFQRVVHREQYFKDFPTARQIEDLFGC
jgi:Phytanoyl-CoA dioxygenase (PhyH)